MGLRGDESLRGQEPLSYIENMARTVGTIKATPENPRWKALVDQIQGAVANGLVSDEGIEAFVKANPKWTAVVANAQYSRESGRRGQEAISPYFHPGQEARAAVPGQPEQPFQTTEEQAFGLPGLQGNIEKEAVAPIPEQKAIAQRADYDAAIARANQMGNYELAKQLIDQKKNLSGGKGLYGGIQYAIDPRTGKYVPYSVDPETRQAVPINTPEGTVATVPMLSQVTEGGNISMVPSRGIPGMPQKFTPTGTRSAASAEEAKQAGQSETAINMGNKLKELVESGKVRVGPIDGRKLRVAGKTGINLTEDDAQVLSIEENLSNQLIQAMRGAAVGPAEQIRFEKSLPRVDQPKALFLKNIETTMGNLRVMRDRAAEMRPVPAAATPANSNTSVAPTDPLKRKTVKFSELP